MRAVHFLFWSSARARLEVGVATILLAACVIIVFVIVLHSVQFNGTKTLRSRDQILLDRTCGVRSKLPCIV